MTIRIVPDSAKIKITARPSVNAPVVSGTDMSFTGTSIQATGEVTLSGASGDDASSWTAGFVQAQWIETNWCYYRGQSNADGSVFLQRGRPPSRPTQACRDCVDASPVNDVFYSTVAAHGETASGTATSAFPLKLSMRHFDRPSETCKLVETNGLTGQPNFLAEAQLEFHFCTILSVRDPAGAFHHLLSFYWNMRWQANFHPNNFSNPPSGFRITRLPAGTGVGVSHMIKGTPTDRRFSGVLTSSQTQSCNGVFRAARKAATAAGSANRHESRVWKNFDVRRP